MQALTWLLFVAAGLRASAAVTTDEEQILQLEEKIKHAWLRHDTATIASIVADDFQSWSFRGQRRGKADLLRAVERSDETETAVQDPVVRVYGDAAIYTAQLIDSGKHADGQAYRTRSCVTAVYVRRAGKWQLVNEHQTIIADAAKG